MQFCISKKTPLAPQKKRLLTLKYCNKSRVSFGGPSLPADLEYFATVTILHCTTCVQIVTILTSFLFWGAKLANSTHAVSPCFLLVSQVQRLVTQFSAYFLGFLSNNTVFRYFKGGVFQNLKPFSQYPKHGGGRRVIPNNILICGFVRKHARTQVHTHTHEHA